MINQAGIDHKAGIIDVGGGNSNLTGALFERGYQDLTVLDISGNSISRMQNKLGATAKKIHWIESDVLDFVPDRQYSLWHDRAAFHFLIKESDKQLYINRLLRALAEGGIFVLSTFSTDGPEKCSGLDICQYDSDLLNDLFTEYFELVQVVQHEHKTPFNTSQDFIYTVWRKRLQP